MLLPEILPGWKSLMEVGLGGSNRRFSLKLPKYSFEHIGGIWM